MAAFRKLYQFGFSVIFPRNYLPVSSHVVPGKEKDSRLTDIRDVIKAIIDLLVQQDSRRLLTKVFPLVSIQWTLIEQ